jgi:Zn-dependent protease
MTPMRQGSLRLFRFAGIDVFLHWSWFLVAYLQISWRRAVYSSLLWNVLEYLALFVIVLLHEFGHALACRQVGGKANLIVLWPLGGVAYVSPPPRPGATLWSIAAGPLVNVALLPVLTMLRLLSAGWAETAPDAFVLVRDIWYINCGLLIFNLLPVFPLDGGQILRSLLWFVMGRANSLLAASIIGFIGVAGLAALLVLIHFVAGQSGLSRQEGWLAVVFVFMLLNCWSGLVHARALARVAKAPRRDGLACPQCGVVPPVGAHWTCGRCRQPFDMFATQAICPRCGTQYAAMQCLECGGVFPPETWHVPPVSVVNL